MGLCEHPVWSRLSANQSRNICLLSWLVRRAVINGRGVVSASWVWSSESTLCRLSLLPSPLIEVANSSCSSCLARCRILTAPPGKPCLSHKSLLTLPQISPQLPSLHTHPLSGARTRLGRCCVNRSPLVCFVPEIHPAAPAYVTQSVYIVKVTPVVRERNKTTQRLSKAGDFVTKGTTIHFYRPCSQKLLTSSHQHTPSLLEGKLSEDKYLKSFLAMNFGKQIFEIFWIFRIFFWNC